MGCYSRRSSYSPIYGEDAVRQAERLLPESVTIPASKSTEPHFEHFPAAKTLVPPVLEFATAPGHLVIEHQHTSVEYRDAHYSRKCTIGAKQCHEERSKVGTGCAQSTKLTEATADNSQRQVLSAHDRDEYDEKATPECSNCQQVSTGDALISEDAVRADINPRPPDSKADGPWSKPATVKDNCLECVVRGLATVVQIPVHHFCDQILHIDGLAHARILAITKYANWRYGVIKHRFLVIDVQGSTKGFKLRLDRLRDPNVPLRHFVREWFRTPSNDQIKMAQRDCDLVGSATQESSYQFPNPPILFNLVSLLRIIAEESPRYYLFSENCWFYCSAIQENLARSHEDSIPKPENGVLSNFPASDARGRIAERFTALCRRVRSNRRAVRRT